MRRLFVLLSLMLTWLLFWEFFSGYSLSLNWLLPAPSQIVHEGWLRLDRLWIHSRATLAEMSAGLLIASLVALPLGIAMHLSMTIRSLFQPICLLLQCIPMFVLAPLFLFWLGWSFWAIALPTALMIFFPLTMTLYRGLEEIPKSLVAYFTLHGATLSQRLFKLLLPYSAPALFSGLRVSVAVAGIGAIAGEWAGAQQGLGVLMLESRRSTDTPLLFAAITALVCLTLALYGSSLLLERWAAKGRYAPKRLYIAFAIFCLAGAIGTASFPVKPSPHSLSSLTPIRLQLDWFPNPNHVPLFAGMAKGFFSQEGIDLTLVKLHDPGDSLPFLMTKQSDLALFYLRDSLIAQRQGMPIVPIAVYIDHALEALLFKRSLDIQHPRDFHARRLGYSLDGWQSSFLSKLTQNFGIVWSEQRRVNFDLVAALGTDLVDVVSGAYWNIEGPHLKSMGIETSYFTLQDLGAPDYPELVLLALSDNNLPVESLLRALKKSLDFSREHPEEAFSLYVNANPDKGEKTLAWEREAWFLTEPLLAQDPWPNSASWDTLESFLNCCQSKYN